MRAMVQLLRAGRAPAEVMAMIAHDEKARRWQAAGRNDPLPVRQRPEIQGLLRAGLK